MSYLGKKVRIKWPKSNYDGQIGEVTDIAPLQCAFGTIDVKMPDGVVITPWAPNEKAAQCELVPEKQNMDINERIQQMEKELSELKEQVANPYKVGDWVYVHDNGSGIATGTVAQLDMYDGDDWYLKVSGARCANSKRFRRATEQEIKQAQQPKSVTVKIGTEGKQVKISKGKIEAHDGQSISISRVDKLAEIMKGTQGFNGYSVEFTEVKVGCVSGITYDQLKKIQDEYNKLNV